uniref:Partial AB-hydrolase lipase domain-containing protein n=1 Tax=Cucumis melo TaxID=3656 RepID=A0A9I9DGZ3_CUCME
MATPLMALVFLIYFFPLHSAGDSSLPAVVDYSILPHALSDHKSLCSQLVLPAGYPCAEHKIQTKDGFLLGLQRVSSRNGDLEKQKGPPILLLHGLFMAGDGWFLNSARQSLGFILPDNGFDVWIGNVRGTRWSHGHSSLSEDEKGTIMSFAALTQPEIAKNVEAAALLSPISYLEHITAPLVRLMVDTHLDTIILASGFHELNFKSDWGTVLLDNLCDRLVNCINVLSSITVIRKGSFSKYDYGLLKNLRVYGQRMPPEFDLSLIPESLPLWMAYGGNDELSDWTDLEHTIKKYCQATRSHSPHVDQFSSNIPRRSLVLISLSMFEQRLHQLNRKLFGDEVHDLTLDD